MVVLEEYWPLVVIRWRAETNDEDIERYIERSLEHLSRAEPHVILHDARMARGLGAAQRKKFAQHIKEHEHAIRAHSAAVAMVSESGLIRGMVTAVGWIFPTPCPQRAFSTLGEATDWLREQLEAKGGHWPAGAVEALTA